MKKLFVLSLAFFALLIARPPLAAEESGYRVIVHPDNPTDSVTRSELSRILLKQRTRWEHGEEIEPVDLDRASPVREQLSGSVHGRSVASIKNYWQRQASAGGPTPPPELAADAEVVAFVRTRPGAIGYVSAAANLDSVKTLSVSDG